MIVKPYKTSHNYDVITSLIVFILFSTIIVNQTVGQTPAIHNHIEWNTIAKLPSNQSGQTNPGLAGAFIGVHNEALIIAGGANFPDGPAWEGGAKVYHDKIYVLQKDDNLNYIWVSQPLPTLENEIAYGLSIPTPDGILCLGGNDNTKSFSDAFILSWDNEKQTLTTKDFPSLPQASTNFSGGVIGDYLYVAGSVDQYSKFFYRIDLSMPTEGWEELPTWPGEPRTHAVGVVQNNGNEDAFYLFKGRIKSESPTYLMHTNSYVYTPSNNDWAKLPTTNDHTLSAGTAVAMGANHILLLGGANGTLFNRLVSLDDRISNAENESTKKKLQQAKDSILIHHPGFEKTVWAYHTITNSWTRLNELDQTSQVTTTALKWGDDIIIPTGEISPCIRTDEIRIGSLTYKQEFGLLNYIIVLFYLGILVLLGFYFVKKQESVEDFFKAGKRIPGWAAGLSIFGTQLSAITFMAIPAKTYATDWLYFFLNCTIIMVAPFVIKYYLPFYRRFDLTTAYEYLEKRFNLLARLIGSSMYIFLQLGRLGIVLLLPSLALSAVTGIDVQLCIMLMGLLSIIYTVLGGIEAVIWTDVLQVFVLLGGALLALIILFFDLGTDQIVSSISNYEKLKILDFRFDFSSPTLWVVLLGGFASNIIQYGSDQTVIQRYLTTKDEQTASKSIWIGAWMAIPATIIFFALGTLLFVYYQSQPEALSISMQKTDAIFPWFIVNTLPDGISGLLIAAIFAASMSSLDSSMNSVSTVVTTDFIKRLSPADRSYLKIARIITAVVGLLGTSLALMMATWGISSLWDQFNLIVGLFTGGLGGIFVLGIFTKKANGIGAVSGLIVSGIAQYCIKEYTDIHFFMYAFTGIVISFGVGYLISLLTADMDQYKSEWSYYNLK